MEFLFDTASLQEIETYQNYFPITGITSNPSIIKKEGKLDFFSHFRAVRSILGPDKTLHIQVLSADYEGILKDAKAILRHVDDRVYIKIPTTEAGLQAMQTLKKQGIGITATAIYTKIQGLMAITAGADFIAPYCNRMENMDIDFRETISVFRAMIDKNKAESKILAASFKNMAQICDALSAGAHTVTVPPALLHEAFQMPAIGKAVNDFRKDWVQSQGDTELYSL